MAGQTVLILGGGTGGLVAANRLRRMLAKEHRVVLVDRSPVYTFEPSLTWVMMGQRDPRRISRDLGTLSRKGIEFITGEIVHIDAGAKKVHLENRELDYDYLVIALGAEYSAEAVPGLNRAWTFYHADGAEGLALELPKLESGRIAIVVPALPYKCPAAVYEGALLIDDWLRRRKLRGDIQIDLFTPETRPMMSTGEHIGLRVIAMLQERDIGFHPGVKLKSVDHQKHEMDFADGATEQFEMLIAVPIHVAPHVLETSGLLNGAPWLEVDRETLATSFEDVYAIGDATMIPLREGLALPKTGVFAHGEAEVVARNLAAQIQGSEPLWAFGGQGACFLETGGGKGSYISGRFFAEPQPQVEMRHPSRFWHWAKVGFERVWLWRWF
jgi:sulfide:quinone oxidoreductase